MEQRQDDVAPTPEEIEEGIKKEKALMRQLVSGASADTLSNAQMDASFIWNTK